MSSVVDVGAEPLLVPDDVGLRQFFGPDRFGGWAARLAESDDLSTVPDPFQAWTAASSTGVEAELGAVRPDLVFGGLLTFALAERLAHVARAPWAFVNPAYVFGPASGRSIEDDFAPAFRDTCSPTG